MVDKIMVILNY